MGLLLVFALALPALAADKNNNNQAIAQDYSALAQSGPIIGKVKSISPTDKTFTLEIDINLLQSKNNGRAAVQALEQQERIARLEQDILRTRNPVQRAQKMQQLAAQVERDQLQQARNQNSGRVVTQHKDFDLESTVDAKVRRQDPPVQYDEKGNPKQYTQKELKELKGDPKQPGYEADWDSLKVGQTIKVTFGKPQTKDNKDNNNKDNKDTKDDNKPRASLIMIIKDAPETDAPAGNKK
jgi:hypothetical protein